MFREVMGLPAHALLVHAAVVFVPLLALVSTGYAVLARSRFRSRLDWAAGVLAVVAPVAAFFAVQSGEEFQEVLIAKNYGPEILQKVEEHQGYGELTLWWSLALGVVTLVLLVVTSPRAARARSVPGWLGLLLGAVVVVLAALNVWYVYLTGDTGAEAVWQGVI
ncbi:DUF2231 domain-containing protein [Plantactinospora sp. KLBMP9567]|uniref:DUF2231 domain-containing protein n=1 Tax=Plantactinospora sp. KLBMP9567 TaxID=3085900 RepID=UPI002981C25D|nr:DUF2231 domain-containing protein [Plantactinospora sp. KLBMP9567]MDW5328777.1 DUF2231 domain-containing protein [Plantactinospora sp. KLBMP9567]